MKDTDSVLVTSTYHPKPGHEDKFLEIWNKKVKPLMLKSGASWASIYHNEDTEEFLFSAHWNRKDKADKFLENPKYEKALSELNKLSLIPPSRAIHEVLKRAA